MITVRALMAFFVELWESVFVPGTTPALITATHASFIALIVSLVVLIFVTRSIHFINLLVLAVLLYGSVIWFIGELKRVKEEEERAGNKSTTESTNEPTKVSTKESTTQSRQQIGVNGSSPRRRKV